MIPKLRIETRYAARKPWVPAARQLRHWIEAALAQAPRGAIDRRTPKLVSVHIVGVRASRALNARYRGKDKPTNVLSFSGPGALPDGEWHLGEIVICAPVMAREARDQAKDISAHWAHITVHGVLHLLGFDHQRPDEALRMEALEVRVLRKMGIADPYSR